MRFNLFHLKEDLKNYGLNPNHWKISSLEGSKALLVHKKDSHFKLLGHYKRGSSFMCRWSDLSLLQSIFKTTQVSPSYLD